jgi:hypothetical protein
MVESQEGSVRFECPGRCPFTRKHTPATVAALEDEARRAGLPYTPIS